MIRFGNSSFILSLLNIINFVPAKFMNKNG
jgi:hypothetical protein